MECGAKVDAAIIPHAALPVETPPTGPLHDNEKSLGVLGVVSPKPAAVKDRDGEELLSPTSPNTSNLLVCERVGLSSR